MNTIPMDITPEEILAELYMEVDTSSGLKPTIKYWEERVEKESTEICPIDKLCGILTSWSVI